MPRYHPIQTCGRAIVPGAGPFIVGILNVTPDSFSDGGDYLDPLRAIEAGRRMAAEGADWLDIGGESTRPGSRPTSEAEQIRRIEPVIAGLARQLGSTGPLLSIDTRSAQVAEAALEAGAQVVNDVSGLRNDPAMAAMISRRAAGIVIMHAQGTPEDMQRNPTYRDVVAEIKAFLWERVACAEERGIPREHIIIDPGIGFGKTSQHNFEILRRAGEFRELGLPVMVGASRKKFIGDLVGATDPKERDAGTLATVAACVLAGVELVRVHNVRDARHVALVSAAIREPEIEK